MVRIERSIAISVLSHPEIPKNGPSWMWLLVGDVLTNLRLNIHSPYQVEKEGDATLYKRFSA